MTTIRLSQAHSLPVEALKERMTTFEGEISKYGVSLAWKGNRADIKGLGVSGEAHLSPTEVTLQLTLGMLAKAAGVDAVKLENSIQKRLKAALE